MSEKECTKCNCKRCVEVRKALEKEKEKSAPNTPAVVAC